MKSGSPPQTTGQHRAPWRRQREPNVPSPPRPRGARRRGQSRTRDARFRARGPWQSQADAAASREATSRLPENRQGRRGLDGPRPTGRLQSPTRNRSPFVPATGAAVLNAPRESKKAAQAERDSDQGHPRAPRCQGDKWRRHRAGLDGPTQARGH